MKPHSDTTVFVSYIDGGKERISFGRLRQRLIDHGYSSEYVQSLVDGLSEKGESECTFAKYKIDGNN